MAFSIVLRASAAAAALIAAASAPLAHAQTGFVVPDTPNADRLADQMRVLAHNPQNIEALLSAGEASVRLNDPAAALQFFARAERETQNNPRVLAGRAAALVELERPGEAMRLFQQAETAGMAVPPMALDRGLAFDLLGYPRQAQRDYRLVLAQGDNDEATRRLALSLGISGDVSAADRVLDPLLRRNDRSAWRVRACILAMNDRLPEAEQIASSMLPGFGPNLNPFFERMASLSPADRAFAVHFGRLAPTANRRADATLTPPIAAVPETPPVALASTTRIETARSAKRPKRTKPDKPPRATARRIPLSAETAVALASPPSVTVGAAPVRLAKADPIAPTPVQAALATPSRARPFVVQLAYAAPAIWTPVPLQPAIQRSVADIGAATVMRTDLPVRPHFTRAVAETPLSPGSIGGMLEPVPPRSQDEPAEPVDPRSSTDSIASGDPLQRRENILALGAILDRVVSGEPAPEAVESPPEPVRSDVAAPAVEAVVEPVAPVVRVAADARRSIPDPALEEPSRTWVQVAGDADEAAFPLIWRQLAQKAPDVLTGQSAWTTPASATNRLLVGPFETVREAQSFVNSLSGSGISAFTWTSAAGQKVTQVKLR